MNKIKLLQRTGTGNTKHQGYTIIFSEELDNQLDLFIVDLQLKLQEYKVFTPSAKDPRFSWSYE